ncbi:MAG: hypothetical protein JXN63_07015 [Candidatus Delongbacteria bacterium]|nr:hypothetical protein [Candidatus Delongbacteria bacterium]
MSKKLIFLVMVVFSFLVSETLFEVKDASDNIVLNVSSDGLRILNQGDTLMVISSDGIRAYIQQDSTKGLSRSFSVTTASSKNTKSQNKVFEIATDEGATFYNPDNNADEIFSVNKQGIVASVNPQLSRDFLINDLTQQKAGNNLLRISNRSAVEAINDSTILWYKKKNAFRVGHINITGDSEVGQASFGSGYRTTASGKFSFASGLLSEASGYGAAAMGISTYSGAIGSISLGSLTRATGYNTVAAGYSTTAQASGSVVFGRFNIVSGSQTQWIDTEPVFVIGNGSSEINRSNAFEILKDGTVIIPELYENYGAVSPKVVLVDQDGKLYVNSKESNHSEYEELKKEIDQLKTENQILRDELNDIKMILNK